MSVYTIIFIFILFSLNCCYSKKYYNYTLFRGIPVNESHLEFFDDISQIYDINFWRRPGLLFRPVEFVIAPDDKNSLLRLADQKGIYLTTVMDDVQKAFDIQSVKSYIRRKMETFDWSDYFRLKDIYGWLGDMNKVYPREMQLQSIGKTYENRKILAVRIALRGSRLRSKVIVEGGIHAREWISPAFVTYMIAQILHAPSSNDSALKNMALTYEWYFVPVLNPDGYEYTHEQDRLWRKNRRNGYHGIDLNRNFGHGFGTVGVSFDKGSGIYCGEKPFSELETRSMAKFVENNKNNLEYYLAFHSYGQYMILPYANSKERLDNFDEVEKIGIQAAERIAARYKTSYSVGTAYDTAGYMASGVSGCWVKSTYRVPYVLTFELRDNGAHGFALPPNQIVPTCLETMDGIISLLTPKTREFRKLETRFSANGQFGTILDKIVIVSNVFLFIIVRFD